MDILSKDFYEGLINNTGDWISKHGVNIILLLIVGLVIYNLGGAFVKFITKIIITGAKKSTWTKRDIKKRHETVSSLLLAVWKIVVIMIVTVGVVKEFAPNLNFTTFVASLGAISVMISLGAQSLIKDFLNGLFIVSENQYRVGDIVEIDGNTGTVRYIGTRTTVIRDFDGNVHYFPNGSISHVVNKTMNYSISRFRIKLAPESDIDKSIDLINKIGEKLIKDEKWKDKIIKAPSFETISSIDGAGIEMVITGKTQPSEQWSVSSKMRQLIVEEFDKNAIVLV